MNNIMGLKSGNSKYPCANCKYVGRLTKKEAEFIDPFGNFDSRTEKDWKDCTECIKSTGRFIVIF